MTTYAKITGICVRATLVVMHLNVLSGEARSEAARTTPLSVADVVNIATVFPRSAKPMVLSADGRYACVVTRHPSLERNCNEYRLTVFDVARAFTDKTLPRHIHSVEVGIDDENSDRMPYKGLQLTGGADGVPKAVFLHGEPQQVCAVDSRTGALLQLTRHSTDIVMYALGKDGDVGLFAAVSSVADDGVVRAYRDLLKSDGGFLWDRTMFPRQGFESGFHAVSALDVLSNARPVGARRFVEYFVASRKGRRLQRVFGTTPVDEARYVQPAAQITATLPQHFTSFVEAGSVSPDGKHAIFWPFICESDMNAPERWRHTRPSWEGDTMRRMYQPYGLVDLETGTVKRLLPAPGGRPYSRPPISGVWLKDGQSVVVHTYDPAEAAAGMAGPSTEAHPLWMEVDLRTGGCVSLRIPPGWDIARYDSGEDTLYFSPAGRAEGESKRGMYALIRREAGRWGKFQEMSFGVDNVGARRAEDPVLCDYGPYGVALSDRYAVGVAENFLFPPEIAIMDRRTTQLTIVSDLNPDLRLREFGEVSTFRWKNTKGEAVRGTLVLPRSGGGGNGIPLVLAFDREAHMGAGPRFVRFQMEPDNQGLPIHVLANSGIGVLLLRGSAQTIEMRNKVGEAEFLKDDFESAITALVDAKIVDRRRVGVSGWSYGGEVVNLLLANSQFQFAAASSFDGGTSNYSEKREWTDAEMLRVKTPQLIQLNGPFSLAASSYFIDRQLALGKATDVLFLPGAEHSLIAPKHRWRAMSVHTDWFRFWLNGYEDKAPEKRSQYEHWRKLRASLMTKETPASNRGDAKPSRK